MTATKMGRPSVYQAVAEQLREHCLSNAGEMLPSLRQLSEMLDVNHATISRALRDLEGEGLVEIMPRKGVFATARPAGDARVELIAFFSEHHNVLDVTLRQFEGIESECRSDSASQWPGGAARSVLSVPPFPDAGQFVRAAKSRGATGLVFLGFGYFEGELGEAEDEFLAGVAAKMPVALAGSPHHRLPLDSASCDPRPQMRQFLERCHAEGARRFEFLGDVGNNQHQRERRAEFDRFLVEKNLSWNWEAWRKDADADLVARLRALPELPEVVVTTNIHRATTVTLETQRRGLQLPGDLRILCFASLAEHARPLQPYATVVLLDEPGVGAAAVRLLKRRMQDRGKTQSDGHPVLERVPAHFLCDIPSASSV